METDILGMSDEDFLKQAPPSVVSEESANTEQNENPPQVQNQEQPTQIEQPQPEAPSGEQKAEGDRVGTPSQDPAAGAAPGSAEGTTESPAASAGTEEKASAEAPQDQPQGEAETKEKAVEAAPDYEGFYKKIMAPFKANGKMIELRSPEEAIQLMQMGANFTRKMQDIAPHRKVLMMLENNGLLDEGKLSFLIDLDKKNPDAIKKLVKEAGIDPLEIDTSAEPAYREGNHRVSDEDVAFQTALQDMQATEAGMETIRTIHTSWDQASKEVLGQSPEILGIIHQQREAGIYDRITTEIHRQRTLGKIAAGVPFLQAYKLVGDAMKAANAFADLFEGSASSSSGQTPNAGAQATPPAVVATRVAAPKPAVTNGDRASAAAPTKTAPPKNEPIVNPLAMSDDEFMKLRAVRV